MPILVLTINVDVIMPASILNSRSISTMKTSLGKA